MYEELVEELQKRAGLSEDQARRSVAVFESFFRERASEEHVALTEAVAEDENNPNLFSGSMKLFGERRG